MNLKKQTISPNAREKQDVRDFPLKRAALNDL